MGFLYFGVRILPKRQSSPRPLGLIIYEPQRYNGCLLKLEDKRMASRLIRNQLPVRVAGSTPVSSARMTLSEKNDEYQIKKTSPGLGGVFLCKEVVLCRVWGRFRGEWKSGGFVFAVGIARGSLPIGFLALFRRGEPILSSVG